MSGFSRGGGGGSIRIKETDGSPSIDAVTEVRLPADMLVDVGGGVVSLPLGSAALVATPIPVTEGGTGSTSASTARTALGLGTAAVVNTGVISGTVPVLDGVGYPALDGSQITNISGGGSALTVQDADGTPIDTAVNTLKFPNGSVTVDSAGVVSIDKYPAPLGVDGASLASFAPYLRAGYTFNDASSSLADSVGVPHDMAAAGVSGTYLQAGKNGTAIKFNSTTHFERPPQGFSPGSSEFTLNWWVNCSDISNLQSLLAWANSAGSIKVKVFYQYSQVRFQENTGFTSIGSAAPTASTWQMITWQRIKDAGNYYNRIFLNGVQVINVVAVINDFDALSLYVGINKSGGYAADTTGDELLYYTGPDGFGAISAAAILELYNSGTGVFLDTVGTPTGLGFSHADLVNYNSYLHDYWKFEESGTPLVDSISNNSLAAVNSPTYAVTGKSNNCVQLNRSSEDYLTRTATFAHAPSQEYSLSCWVYVNATGLSETIWQFWGSTSQVEQIMFNAAGTFEYFRVKGGFSVNVASGTGAMTVGWHHCVVVKTETAGPLYACSLYLDGVLIGSETPVAVGSQHDNSSPVVCSLVIGTTLWLTGHSLDGKIDELAYWKGTALGSAAVTALYNAGAGRFLESV